MENWRLITLIADDIILEKNETSFEKIRRSVDLVAHEIAHQWIGDLVTMNWWPHIWLNEGFASFLSSKCSFALFPQWKKVDTTLNDVLEVGFDADSLESSHPIVFEFECKQNITTLFNAITYKKGE
ncbi:Puromycin-sensitive aminopeptidase-like protein [Dinothrombium tinctorium]|uniref:Puromycin-sensitive aminopeptidase-like protein n=1 Tax=Dinothrombium tinctorium TaxID=1965070 RepID=A0A443RBE5_9ACAR|nr:Puromycin-sensitive aminopeptidase-like protein [Dinothrombium tinctorium]